MSGEADVFLGGVPVPVDPQRIERELATLWKPASEERGGQGPVVRACVANLVVRVSEPARWGEVVARVEGLARAQPLRAILLAQIPAGAAGEAGHGGPRLRAAIRAICSAAGGGTAPVCCEEIRLLAAPGDEHLFPGAVTPLLVPDVPVILWWTGCLEEPLLRTLAGPADRLVVDAREAAERPEDLECLLDLERSPPARERSDCGWIATEPWRAEVAAVFDDPVARELLPRLVRVEATAVEPRPGDGPPRGTSGLLAGWIVSRLGWSPETLARDGTWRVFASQGAAGPVELRVRHEPDARLAALPEGSLTRLAFVAREDGGTASVTLELDPDTPDTARLAVHTTRSCHLPRAVLLRRPTEIDLLADAVSGRAADGVRAQALAGLLALHRAHGTPEAA